MLNEYIPFPLFSDHVVTNSLKSFDLITHYSEIVDETVPIFEHSHDLYEIFCALNGSVNMICQGEKLTIEKGHFIMIAKNVPHKIVYKPNIKYNLFTLIFDIIPKNNNLTHAEEDEAKAIADSFKTLSQKSFIIGENPKPINDILDAISYESIHHKVGWITYTDNLYSSLIIFFIRALFSKSTPNNISLGQKNIALAASKYIHANYSDETLSIDKVSKALNVTPRHINRLFSTLFCTSFAHTVNIIRMEYAKRFLINTTYSIEDIAGRVGLSSAKTLNRLFNEQEGMSPSQYRKNHKI